MEYEYELNLMPFYALALSRQSFIHKDIDDIYKKRKEEYYSYGKASKFYDCVMAKETSLVTEEYFKKCIGIFEYDEKHQNCGSELENGIYKLFKKGYRKIYLYFKKFSNEDEIDMKRFFTDCLKKRLHLINDDEANSSMVAAIFFTMGHKHVLNIEFIHTLLLTQWKFYEGERRISLEQTGKKHKKEVDEYLKKIPKNLFDELVMANKTVYHGYDFLFDIEDLSLSIFDGLEFDINDTKKLILSYICTKNYKFDKPFDEPFDDYLHHNIFLLGMCKAYKKVKEVYFANNKETMYVELGTIKKELQEYKKLLQLEKEKNNSFIQQQKKMEHSLEQENESLKKENEMLKMKIEKMQNDSEEVIALREYIFRENNDISSYSDENIDVSKLNELKGVIIGGHPNWKNKMKDKLPDWNFIDVNISNIDNSFLSDKNIVIFNTSYLKHALYYRIMSYIKNKNYILGYISSTNLEISMREIYEICKNR